MWPWLMIIAGALLIVGALIARHRMMRDYRAGLALASSRTAGSDSRTPDSTADVGEDAPLAEQGAAVDQPEAPEVPQPPAAAKPARPRITITEPSPLAAPPPPRTPQSAQPLFADLPVGHRLTSPPTIRVRAQEVPLQDWLRYYADGNAWSGVIQSISDRISGDRELQPYFGSMDRSTLQRHVMATVMMLTGEGLTVGAVRRLADAHLRFVQAGGDPLTEEAWNRLAATFANALREHLVPESAVSGLDATVAPLRSVIVARRSI